MQKQLENEVVKEYFPFTGGEKVNAKRQEEKEKSKREFLESMSRQENESRSALSISDTPNS